MSFEIPVDTPSKPRRGPPARFLSMMKMDKKADSTEPASERPSATSMSQQNEAIAQESSEMKIRTVANPLFTDSSITYTKENCIANLEQAYPEFANMNDVVTNNPKWQDKVAELEKFESYISAHKNSFMSNQEAVIQYVLLFSKDFKAANMNILKIAFSICKTVILQCGAGPRACGPVVDACVAKIHDKKVGPDVSTLLSTICEKIGPNTVINSICSVMTKSKVAAQQKSILIFFISLVDEFGANAISVKDLLNYVQGPSGLGNSKVDVRDTSIQLICTLYKQLGDVVKNLVNQSDINDLLKKKVLENIDNTTYDPALLSRYVKSTPKPSVSSSKSKQSASTPSVPVVASISLSDLIDAYDATNDLQPLIKQLRFNEGKDSWKTRQEGVEGVTSLMEKKGFVQNNKAIGDVLAVLKERMSETNINLRARVFRCVGTIAKAVKKEINQYTASVISELMKYTGESKANVVDSLYFCLTSWVEQEADTASVFNSVALYLPQGFKNSSGKQALLTWLNKYTQYMESKAANAIVANIMDCLTDRSPGVRSEATKTIQAIYSLVSESSIERALKGRPSPDQTAIHAIIDPLQPAAAPKVSMKSTEDLRTSEVPTDNEADLTRSSFANREGVRVLSKKKNSMSFAERMKSRAKSSIPKPMPLVLPKKNSNIIRTSGLDPFRPSFADSYRSDRISVATTTERFFMSRPRRSKEERENQDAKWSFENADMTLFKEECSDCIEAPWLEKMFSESIEDVEDVYNFWSELCETNKQIMIQNIDIVLKYSAIKCTQITDPFVFDLIMKLLYAFFAVLIDMNYTMNDFELLIILSPLIVLSGDNEYTIRDASKLCYQSLVGCVNRLKMFDTLIHVLRDPNDQTRLTTIIFFREMIEYQEVKQVLHDNMNFLTEMVEDKNVDCRTHARLLYNEAFQENVFTIDELKKQITTLSPVNRDLLLTMISIPDDIKDELMDLAFIKGKVSKPPAEQEEEEHLMSVHSEYEKKEDEMEFVFPFPETSETDLIFPSYSLHSLRPIEQEPHIDVDDDSLKQAFASLQELFDVLSCLFDTSLLHQLYEDELDAALLGLNTIAQWMQNEDTRKEDLYKECEPIMNLVLKLIEVQMKRTLTEDSFDDSLLYSLIQILLFVVYSPTKRDSLMVQAGISEITISYLIDVLLDCIQKDTETHSKSDKERRKRYQQILTCVCYYPRVSSIVEIIMEKGNNLPLTSNNEKTASILAGMLRKIRENVLPTLLQGDYVQLVELLRSNSSLHPVFTEEVTSMRQTISEELKKTVSNPSLWRMSISSINSTTNSTQNNEEMMRIEERMNELRRKRKLLQNRQFRVEAPKEQEQFPTVEEEEAEYEDNHLSDPEQF